jgi:hypothetical protein
MLLTLPLFPRNICVMQILRPATYCKVNSSIPPHSFALKTVEDARGPIEQVTTPNATAAAKGGGLR